MRQAKVPPPSLEALDSYVTRKREEDDRVVGIIEARDGTIMDVVRQIKEIDQPVVYKKKNKRRSNG